MKGNQTAGKVYQGNDMTGIEVVDENIRKPSVGGKVTKVQYSRE